jgi:hypothetical protein
MTNVIKEYSLSYMISHSYNLLLYSKLLSCCYEENPAGQNDQTDQ